MVGWWVGRYVGRSVWFAVRGVGDVEFGFRRIDDALLEEIALDGLAFVGLGRHTDGRFQ